MQNEILSSQNIPKDNITVLLSQVVFNFLLVSFANLVHQGARLLLVMLGERVGAAEFNGTGLHSTTMIIKEIRVGTTKL